MADFVFPVEKPKKGAGKKKGSPRRLKIKVKRYKLEKAFTNKRQLDYSLPITTVIYADAVNEDFDNAVKKL